MSEIALIIYEYSITDILQQCNSNMKKCHTYCYSYSCRTLVSRAALVITASQNLPLHPSQKLAKNSLLSLCLHINMNFVKTSVRGMQYVLDMTIKAKKPDDLVHKLSYKCNRTRPLVLWPYPEDFEKLAFLR